MEEPRKKEKDRSKKPVELIFEDNTIIRRGVPKWKQVLQELDPNREKLSKRLGRKKKKTVSKKYCDRCGKLYVTYSKRSRYCDDCKFPTGKGGKISNELKWDEKKQEWTNL